MHRAPVRAALALCCSLAAGVWLPGCRSAYYGALERVGVEKRHILASRVEDGREDQREAQEQVLSTYELFVQATGFEGGDLEAWYRRVSSEYEASEADAQALRDRIGSIEQVAQDLFAEWEEELDLIANRELRSRSAANLSATRARYGQLIRAMRRAADSMDPVLTAFRDQVLYLKHNLNAAAVASLENNARAIQGDVDALIHSMQDSIAEADAFIATLEGEESAGARVGPAGGGGVRATRASAA
jgi:hypothetical protein